MVSSYFDSSVSDSFLADSPTLGVREDGDDINYKMMEDLKTMYNEVNKEYRRYVVSEIIVGCYKEIPDHPNLVPQQLSDKLKTMIINMDILEHITKTDKSGTKSYLYNFKDEDLLKLQSVGLTTVEESCLKTAVKRLLLKKCKAFQDKKSEVEKNCKMLKLVKSDSSGGGLLGRTNESIKSINEITEKMKLCESLLQSINELHQMCLEQEVAWKDVMMKAYEKIEAKLEVLNAESRLLNAKLIATICSENENFVKGTEILWSALQNQIQKSECELKTLAEKLQEYETAEQDPKYKNIVKMYNKIQKKIKHLNWCFESMQVK